jgi:hypothetical protein
MQGHANRRGNAARRSLPARGIVLLLLLAFPGIAYPGAAMAASGFGAFYDCLTALGGFFVGTAHGDTGTTQPASNAPVPIVVKAADVKSIGPGSRIVLTIDGLKEAVEKDKLQPLKLVLYLDHIVFKDIVADSYDPASNQLAFQLNLSKDNRTGWNKLLGQLDRKQRTVQVSVGTAEGIIQSSTASDVQVPLVIARPGWIVAGYVISLVTLVALFALGYCTNALRDSTPDPGPGKKRPYSLARTQIAFWTYLVVSSFVFLYLVTGSLETITSGVLVLIGISTGTLVGGAIIDQAKATTAANAPPPTPPAPAPEPPKSDNFFFDLISDAKGATIHRFQMVVWTLVLGAMFVIEVYTNLQMPDFDPMLLTLMGISGGTYVGLKIPEKQQ